MRSVNTLPLPCPPRCPATRLAALLCTGVLASVLAQANPAPVALLAPVASMAPLAPSAQPAGPAAAPLPGQTPALEVPDLQPLQAEITRLSAQLVRAPAVPGAAPSALRVELQVGQLDPRLRLAPCQQVLPYWPAGQRVLSHARIGLRCVQGRTRWNVYLPVAIRLWGTALAATGDLPAGTTLAAHHLALREVDLAARPDPALVDSGLAIGRTLTRALSAGQALTQGDVKLQQWVRAGEVVKLVAGNGQFQITGEAQALGSALEGQVVRARTDTGRVLQGVAAGDRLVRVPL